MPPTRRPPATAILYREAGRNHARLLTMSGRRGPPPPPAAAPSASTSTTHATPPQAPTPRPVTATVLAPGAQPPVGTVVTQPPAPPSSTTGYGAPFAPPPAVAVYGADDPPEPPPPGVAPQASDATSPGHPAAPPVPRRWWAGEDNPGSLDLPPPPALWEWWCEVLRRDGYTASSTATIKAGPPPTPEGAVFPRPGQARIHRAWSGGWDGVYPPISAVIREERDAAHRAAIDEARARREAAIQQALDDDLRRQVSLREAHLAATMREGQILDTLRGANLLGAANTVRIHDKLRALIERSMDTWVAEGTTVSLPDAIKYTREIANASRALASMASTVVETSRLAAGEATAIVGAAPSAASGANPTDRAQAMEAVRHIAQLAAAAGIPGVFPGGFAGGDGWDAAGGAGDGPAGASGGGAVVSEYEAAVAVEPRGHRGMGGGAGHGQPDGEGAAGPPPVDPSRPPSGHVPPEAHGAGLAGPVVAPQGAVVKPPSHPVAPAAPSAFAPPEAMPGVGAFGGGPGGYGGGYGGAFG